MTKTTYHYPPAVSFWDKVYGLRYNSDAIKVMNRQFNKLGDSYTIQSSLSPYTFIFTKEPLLIDQILRKNHRKYDKSIYQTKMLRKYVGRGLLTNYGLDWRRQRRLIQPGFSNARIEGLNQIMFDEIQKCMEEIPNDVSLDFYMIFNRLAFRVVAKSLFSSHSSEEIMNTIAQSIDKSQKLFISETRNPLFAKYLKYSGTISRHLNTNVEEVRRIFKNLVAERKKSQESHNDLLDLMLTVTYKDTGLPMEEEQLIDELLILFIAGHETTANALSFTFWLLGKNTNYQEQIRKELQNLGSEALETSNLFKPSIFQNILNESMRLYPPAWVADRQALEEDSYKNYHWPKNTIIIGNMYAMNRRPDLWENPDEFIPERFEDPKEVKDKVYIPFGSGPRYCIGEHFAKMEMQMVLRYFFANYRFESLQRGLKIQTYVTLRPEKVLGKKIRL